jgi:hypothetical protein
LKVESFKGNFEQEGTEGAEERENEKLKMKN